MSHGRESDKANTLNTFDIGDVRTSEAVVYALDRASFNQGKNAQYDFEISDKGINAPLVAKGPSAVCHEVKIMDAYQHHGYRESEVLGTLTAGQNGGIRGDIPLVCCKEEACYWDGGQVVGTITANNASGSQRMPDKENFNCVIQKSSNTEELDAVFYPQVGEGVVGTLDAHYSAFPGCRGGMERTMVAQAVDTSHADDVCRVDDVVPALQSRDYKGGKLVACVDCRNATEDVVNGALQSNAAHSLNGNNVVRIRYIVRRLTPLECERLQGYPDGWTDIGDWTDTNGKKRQTSDAARYKALGNSIALPPLEVGSETDLRLLRA